jgi:ABC-type enterochelin transport system permease subunit
MYAQRFYSALWFMLAGSIAGLCGILYDFIRPHRNPDNRMLFILFLYLIIPSLLAGISGFIIGADILNPNKIRNARQAGIRGLYVSLAAWLIFAAISSFVAARDSNKSFFYMLVLVLSFGSIIVGWLIAGIGIATGLLLYRLRKPHNTA